MDGASFLDARLAHVPPGALDFVPVPVKSRRDGWSPAAQRGFILALAAGLGVSAAARAVGRTRQTAYRLRRQPGGASFAAAWDRALHFNRNRPLPPGSTTWERGVEGVPVPIVHRGQIVGWRRKYCDRALGSILASLHAARRADPPPSEVDEKLRDCVQVVTFGGASAPGERR
jgi:hypothetical protein